jgi:ssDNA-binding Zn-finger/Zn-ribbon topoisomerase 1
MSGEEKRMELRKGLKTIRNTGHYSVEPDEKRCRACGHIKRNWQFRPGMHRCNDCVNARTMERKLERKRAAEILELVPIGQQIPLIQT